MRRRAHLRRREKATEPREAMAMAIAEPLDARSRKTALIMSTVALAACFMIWTVFSIIGVRIQRDFGLNATQFGLLVGMPVLTGALSRLPHVIRSEEHTAELQSLMRISYAVFCLKKKSDINNEVKIHIQLKYF